MNKIKEIRHIVFPMIGLPKSGGVRVIVQHINGLVKRGHKVTVLLSRPVNKVQIFPLHEGAFIIEAKRKMNILLELCWLMWNIPRDADAIIGNYYLSSYPTALFSILFNKSAYYYIQGYEVDFFKYSSGLKTKIQQLLASFSYKLPLHQVTISSWLRNVLYNSTGKDPIVICDGVDTDVFSPRSYSKDFNDVKTILCIGRKDRKKGFHDFLSAIELVSKGIQKKIQILVATQDRNLSIDISVPVKVVFPYDDEELSNYYREADVFVFPSLQEGFGLPPLEAMSCGIPVVTTDCGGIRDYAEHGVNCLIVPVKDPNAIAKAICRILDDRQLAKQLFEAGRETACRFTWDVMIDKFEKVLLEFSA